MNKSLKFFGLASTAAFVLSLSARATTYNGNGDYGFSGNTIGPVGGGSLTFTSSAGILTGTITPGANNGTGNNGQLYDELVIYISTNGTTGFTSTATLTDTTTNNTILARSVSGYDGTTRATINFAAGFAARYAIAISPTNAAAGELFGLTTAGAFTAIQSVNLSPTGAGNPNYTFSLTLSNIGSPTSFGFSTTYLNEHPGGTNNTVSTFRSGEAYNSVTDTSTTPNTVATAGYNPGTDTVTLGVNTFAVPEPGTWAMIVGGLGVLIGFQRRLRRV